MHQNIAKCAVGNFPGSFFVGSDMSKFVMKSPINGFEVDRVFVMIMDDAIIFMLRVVNSA